MPNSEFIAEPIEPGVFPGGTDAWKTYWAPAIEAVRGPDGVWAALIDFEESDDAAV